MPPEQPQRRSPRKSKPITVLKRARSSIDSDEQRDKKEDETTATESGPSEAPSGNGVSYRS
jgi:hypothetical protein